MMKCAFLLALLVFTSGCLPASYTLTLRSLRPRLEEMAKIELNLLQSDPFDPAKLAAATKLRQELEERIDQIAREADEKAKEGAEFNWKLGWGILSSLGVSVAGATLGKNF